MTPLTMLVFNDDDDQDEDDPKKFALKLLKIEYVVV